MQSQYEKQVLQKLTQLLDGVNSEKVLTVDQLWQFYLNDHAKPNLKTWRNMERAYNCYFSEFRDQNCLEVKKIDVVQWHNRLAEENGAVTANRALQLMRTIYFRAIEWDLIPLYNPAVKIRCKRTESRQRFLQPEELARFFAACSTLRYRTSRDFILMCLFTGQRSGNVRHMRWDEISFGLKLWNIPMTKNGTSHKVPLVSEAFAILRDRRKNSKSEWVFQGKHTTQADWSDRSDRPIGDKGVRDAFRKVVERAGITHLTLHDLRRTHASYQAIAGANISVIARTLNHKDLASTQIYARLHLDPVRNAMSKSVQDMLTRAGVPIAEPEDQTHLISRLAPALPAQDSLLTTREASEFSGIPTWKLEQMRRENSGPTFIKNGFSVYYSEAMLTAWIAGRSPDPTMPLLLETASITEFSHD